MNSPTKSPPSGAPKKSLRPTEKNVDPRLKILSEIWTYLHSPLAIGIYVTLLFIFFAKTFYHVRNLNEAGVDQSKFTNLIFQTVEGLDFILTDARFVIRGERPQSDSQVALIAIDDDSLEVVGRWPWNRELMAKLIDNLISYGVKAIALDVIWSEPQENSSVETLNRLDSKLAGLGSTAQQILKEERSRPQPDDVLAETIKKHSDKIVMGIFPTEENERLFLPYTDYCRNEAFNRINGSVFVKPDNITLAVEDTADLFEPLKFNEPFQRIFDDIEKQRAQLFLSRIGKKTEAELNGYEKNRLRIFVSNEVMNYCDRWLITDAKTPGLDGRVDEYYEFWKDFFAILTNPAEIQAKGLATAKFEVLAGLTPEAAIQSFKSKTLSHPVPQHRGWTINLPKFQEAANFSGSFKAEQDNDGKIRRNPLFYRTGNRIGSSFIPSLALQTYLVANPGYQAQVEIGIDPKDKNQKIIKGFRIADVTQDEDKQEVVKVPVDGQGRLKIDYAGPRYTYAHIPARELFTDSPEMRVDQKSLDGVDPVTKKPRNLVNKAAFLKDKIVMIGATAVGIYDLRVTPFDKNFPGPETHVTVLDNLVRKQFIRVDPHEATTMIWVLGMLGVLVAAGVAFAGPFLGFFFVLASEGALVWIDQLLLKRGLVSTMILPALLVLSLYVVMTLYKYFTEERKKKHLRSTFSKYVSPAIVDEILKSPENIELGGKKQRMSVFFSDVRGFTTISEKLDPQMLSHVLNLYLTPMTQIVFANKGTLDKYMGDAVMAFFGAPIAFPDHAKYACRCALQSIKKLREIQKEFAAEGLPMIDIGIGINTSEMNVGNMGSDTVRSYTVMGDGVNLGSRLEGINKEYGTRIIISEFTHEEVKDSFTTREVDSVRVKGKLKPVRIYELISEGKAPEDWQPCLQAFEQGLKEYHQKNFKTALPFFQKALSFREDDEPAKLYIERCETYIQEPPPADWDGVFVMKTK